MPDVEFINLLQDRDGDVWSALNKDTLVLHSLQNGSTVKTMQVIIDLDYVSKEFGPLHPYDRRS